MKDRQIDSVIQAHPDETMHLTNREVKSSNINETSHLRIIDSLIKKEINHHHHIKTQLTQKNLNH